MARLLPQAVHRESRRARRSRRDQVLGITTVEVDAGDFAIDAHGEVTATALLAHEAMAAMPTDADSLTNCP